MTVNCLTKEEKTVVINLYNEKRLNQKQIAECANTSERTIHRVLVEAGLATPVARIKGDAYTVMQLLKEHGVDIPKLKQMLAVNKLLNTSCMATGNDVSILEPAPWYPDTSGEWVEIPDTQNTAPKLYAYTKGEILTFSERTRKAFTPLKSTLDEWSWDMGPKMPGRIVAYKVTS